jgi:hypothetical protein
LKAKNNGGFGYAQPPGKEILMKTVMVHINDDSKFQLFVNFLKEIRFVQIEECVQTTDTEDSDDNIPTLGDLFDSGFAGLWSSRTDIQDSPAFARKLRKESMNRGIGDVFS